MTFGQLAVAYFSVGFAGWLVCVEVDEKELLLDYIVPEVGGSKPPWNLDYNPAS